MKSKSAVQLILLVARELPSRISSVYVCGSSVVKKNDAQGVRYGSRHGKGGKQVIGMCMTMWWQSRSQGQCFQSRQRSVL